MTQQDGYRELYRLSLAVPDPRKDRGKRHQLPDLLFVAVVGLIAGSQNAEDLAAFCHGNLAWLRQFVGLERGVPSHDCFLTVLGLIKPEAVEELVREWVSALRLPGVLTTEGGHVAFDGQALRGSLDRAAGKSPLYLVSAYLTGAGVVLGTGRVDDKSNEITAIPDLIRSLNLRGAVVTTDALNCQTEIAAYIREVEAHYCLQVKRNQPKLHKEIVCAFATAARQPRPGEAPIAVERYRDVDKGHGRLETRTCIVLRDLSEIHERDRWTDLSCVVAVVREIEDVLSGKKSQDTSLHICSDPTRSAKHWLEIIRNHWHIENSLHWGLDVVFGSDAHKVRHRQAAENFGRLRRLCSTMVKQSKGWGMSERRIRLACSWNPDNLLRVLAGETIARPRTRAANRKGAKDEVVPARTAKQA